MEDVMSARDQEANPGVSVVVPCFNGAKFLAAAIDSALAQSYAGPTEVLVGDDGSRDGSASIVESYAGRVRLLRHPDGGNHGLPATRNLCLRHASFCYAAFLDADDTWLPEHLSRLVGALEANPNVFLAVDNGLQVSENDEDWGARTPNAPPGRLSAEDVLLNQWFPPCAVVVRRTIFNVVGYFDESMRSAEDQDMWLRILESHQGLYIEGQGYQYRIHSGQMSQNPILWDWASIALEQARRRHDYPASVVRKRRAVLAYRKGQAAVAARNYTRAALLFALAGVLDPVRAARFIASARLL